MLPVILFLAAVVICLWLYLWLRRQGQAGLSTQQETFLDHVPSASAEDAVLVSREHGQLIYVNDRAREWLSMNGRHPNLEDVARQAQPANSFLELFAGEHQASFQLGNRWVEASSHRIPAGPDKCVVVVLRELGSGSRNPESLDLSVAMAMVNQIGELVNASQGVEQVLQTLLSIVRQVIPADAGEICLWDDHTKALYPRGWVGDSAYVLALAEVGGMYRPGEGITGWMANNHQPLLVNDSEDKSAILPKLLDKSPYRSFLGVPLMLGDRFIGTFELAAIEKNRFAQKHLALLQSVSKQLSISIYNAELYTEQVRHVEDLISLQDILNQDDEDYVTAVYRALTAQIGQLLRADMVGVLLYDASRQALVPELPFYGVPDTIVRQYMIVIAADSPQYDIWDNQQYWVSNDISDEPLVEAMGLMPLVNATGVYNTALMPMHLGEKRIGVIQVSNKRSEGGFTLRDIQNLRVLAAQAAVVVENLRLYQNERHQETELIGLQEITHAIESFEGERKFYSTINDRIAKLTGTAMCGILRYDDTLHKLIPQPPFYGVSDALVMQYEIDLKPGTTLAQIWEEVDYWYTNQAATDRVVVEAGLEDFATTLGVRQTMMAALSVGKRRLGVVQISNKLNGEEFTERDVRLLRIYATQAAALIENANLFLEARHRAEEAVTLRDESETLRRIAELSGAVLTPDESLSPLLEEISRLTTSPKVFVHVYDAESGRLVVHPHYVYGQDIPEAITYDTYQPGFEHSVAVSRRPFISNDIPHDMSVLPAYAEMAARLGIMRGALVPLVVGDKSLGEIGIANRDGTYSKADLRVLYSVALQVAGMLDRVSRYHSAGEDLNQRMRQLDAIARVSSELTSTLDLDRVLETIAQEAVRTTSALGSSVTLLKPSSEWADPKQPEISHRLGQPLLDGALSLHELVALQGDVDHPAALIFNLDESDMEDLSVKARSVIVGGFSYEHEIVGVIALYHDAVGHFDESDIEFVQTLASKATLGYGNSVRYAEQIERSHELRRRVDQLNQIFELGQMLHTNTDQVTMLEAIAYSVQSSVGFDAVVMMLVDDKAGVLRRVAQAGLPLDVFNATRNATLSLAEYQALAQPQYQISESYFFPVTEQAQWADIDLSGLTTAHDNRRVLEPQNKADWHSGDMLLVPLTSANGGLLGLMVMGDPYDNKRPSQATIETLEIFAHHASTTIESNQLYLESLNSAEEEARLNEVMTAITRTLEIEEILKAVAQGALRLLPFQQISLALLNYRQADGYDVLRIDVLPDGELQLQRQDDVVLHGTAMSRTCDTVEDHLYHLDEHLIAEYPDLAAYYAEGERTSLILPLVTGGLCVGGLHLGSNLVEAYGFEEYRVLLRRIGNLVAVAIQNARLLERAVNLQFFNQSVVESIQQGIIVLDGDQRLMIANDFMMQHFGWMDDLRDKKLFEHLPVLGSILQPAVNATLTDRKPRELLNQTFETEDKAFTSNFYIYPMGGMQENQGVVVMVEDVSDRTRLEQDVQARAAQLAALTEVSSRITSSLDYGEVLSLALDEMRRVIDYDVMTFWVREGERLALAGARGYEDDTIPMGVNISLENHERLKTVVESRYVLRQSPIEDNANLPGEALAQSWMGVPLVNQNNVSGVILLNKQEADYYDSQAEQAAFAFANQVAVALANANLFSDAERREQRLRLLNRVSVALGQSLDSEDILEIALREIAQILNSDRARAMMIERDVKTARVVVEYPRGDNPPDELISLQESDLYRSISHQVQPLIIPDINSMDGVDLNIQRELLPRALTAYVLLPISIGGQVIGAFEMEFYDGPHNFVADQTDLGRIIANQAAITLQNTSLLEQTLTRSRELETLLEAAQSTSLTLDLKQVYRSVVDQMIYALEMDDCALMIWDEIDAVLEVRIDTNREGRAERVMPEGALLELARHPARLYALREREVVIINDEKADLYPEEYKAMRDAGDSAHVLVPLVVRDHSIGLLQLELYSQHRMFTHRDTRLAQALGAQAAASIENARLSTETTARVEELYIINDLSQSIASTIEIEDMIEVVRERIPGIAAIQDMYLALYDEDNEMINFPLAVRNGVDYRIAPRKLGNDEVSFVIRNRRPLSMGSDYFSPDELRRNLKIVASEPDVKSYLGVPLISGDKVVGVLAVRDTERKRAFGVNSQGILTTIGAQLGAAMQTARLVRQLNEVNESLNQIVIERTDELRQERDSINTLYRIASELSRSLDLERVLKRALEMVGAAVGANDGVIFQIDPSTDQLMHRATLHENVVQWDDSSFSQQEEHPAVQLAFSLIDNPSERAAVVDDLIDSPLVNHNSPDVAGWRSALAVLLEVNDDIHGVMILISFEPNHFNESHVRLVIAAANQVSVAINNSDLYSLIRDQADRLGALVLSEQQEAEKSNSILEGIADGVMLADAAGKVVRFNSAAERILEMPRDQVIGRPLSTLYSLERTPATQWMDQVRQWQDDPELYRPDEFLSQQIELEDKVVNVRLSPVYNENEFLGTVLVFRDVTKEVEVDRLKSEFISNVTHELRTPMTSIKGYADLLLLGAAGPVADSHRNFLQTIKANADRLGVLVDDLLNISQLDNPRQNRLSLEPVNLKTILDTVTANTQARANHEEKNMAVALDIASDLPMIQADPNRLTQVFTNLVDNAFNYSHPNSTIYINAKKDGPEYVLVSVKDEGIGIPEEFGERVWERFGRYDDHALVMEVAGTGLGLSIVKSLVERHHGDVWFESEVGKGTTFFVRLPIGQYTT